MSVPQPPPLPSIIGHRGAAGHAPENTLASIRTAATLGAAWVEFDAMLTGDGEMNDFRAGIERIIARSPVPVLPMGLRGLWGSVFSRDRSKVAGVLPKRFWSRIHLEVGELVAAEDVTAAGLEDAVRELRAGQA